MEEAVALFDYPVVTLQGFEVEGIGLGNKDVEVAAAAGGGALQQVDVVGAEEDGTDDAD